MQSARAGISYSDFWKMTPREWEAYMEGYGLRIEDDMRRLRVVATVIANVNGCDITPERLIPLHGDMKIVEVTMTLDERFMAYERIKKMKTKNV